MSELGIPSVCLMENAGAGAARIAVEMLARESAPVLCVAGPGGNGGDALVAARHLAIAGVAVRILRSGAPTHPDAAVNSRICAAMGISCRELGPTPDDELAALPGETLVVDGLYGSGLTRAIEGREAAWIDAIARRGLRVLALDVPSGLDCDTGEPLGTCVRALVTATFVAPKLGFANPRSRAWTGEVRVVGIGAPR